MPSFEYKILHNILFLNKKSYLFRLTESPQCSDYNAYDETLAHLYCKCDSTRYLLEQLIRHFHDELTLPTLATQAAVFGPLDDPVNNK